MDKDLIGQLEDVIASLHVAEAKAKQAMHTMRQRRVFLGLDHAALDEDIARLIRKARHTKLLAERRVGSASADEQKRSSPRPEVDGRVVALNEAGNALVVQPVQETPPALSVVPEEVEGAMAVSDESGADTLTEPAIIPPAILEAPAVADAPADAPAQPDTGDET
jgi:hypothetical protein